MCPMLMKYTIRSELISDQLVVFTGLEVGGRRTKTETIGFFAGPRKAQLRGIVPGRFFGALEAPSWAASCAFEPDDARDDAPRQQSELDGVGQ